MLVRAHGLPCAPCDHGMRHVRYAEGLSFRRLTKPKEIYNLGAQSHVQVSFELPQYTAEASGVVSTPSDRPYSWPLSCRATGVAF